MSCSVGRNAALPLEGLLGSQSAIQRHPDCDDRHLGAVVTDRLVMVDGCLVADGAPGGAPDGALASIVDSCCRSFFPLLLLVIS
jgi:hypothetical protein